MIIDTMKLVPIIAAVLIGITTSIAVAEEVNKDFIIGGYLPDYRSYINVNTSAIHLTDLMIFSLTPEAILQYKTSSVGGACCLSSHHFDQARKAKAYKQQEINGHPDLRLLLTVGGGGRSNGFDNIVSGSSQVQFDFVEALAHVW